MNASTRRLGGLMKVVTKKKIIIFSMVILYLFSSIFSAFSGSASAASANAYRFGTNIKFEGFVYTFRGRDTRATSTIQNWAIYTEPNFKCGNFIIVDNPATTTTVALRETHDSPGQANPVMGDCVTIDINTQPPVIDITTAAQCAEAKGKWTATGSQCALTNDANVSHRSITGGAGSNADSGDTCESKSPALGWIMCPVINLIDSALNWVDTQIQALLEIDQSKYRDPDLKRAWTSIRNVAFIILIPIMLTMVLGTALGFDFFDAYTVKKALPRMIAAIIFITLSWEICTFLINFFNVIGGGILGLITSPFRKTIEDLGCQSGNLNLTCLFSVESGVNGSGILHSLLFIPTAVASTVGLIVFLIFFGSTLLLGIGAAFIVLLARQMFVVAFMLVAPLAILAWIFPGNDKLWKSWWGTFSKLLLMFPLIMLIIGTGRIFALLLNTTGGGGLDGAIINPIAKLAAYVLPYVFIPFTFKFAGGLFGNLAGIVNDKNKGLFDRAKKRRHQKWERSGAPKLIRGRAEVARRLNSRADASSKAGSILLRTARRGIAGSNIEEQYSALNAKQAKEINDRIATGTDGSARGASVDLKAAMATAAVHQNADGTWDNAALATALRREKSDGSREYKTLGGAWVGEAEVKEGHRKYKTPSQKQAILSYEMRKAMEDGQVEGVSERYASLAKDQWGMTDTEAGGAWIGAGFENQNQHLEFKNTDWKGNLDKNKFATEAFEKKGSYPLSQMSAHTIKQLEASYLADTDEYLGKDAAGNKLTMGTANATQIAAATAKRDDTRRKVQLVAESFMTRYGAGGGGVGAIDPATGAPIPVGVPGAPGTGAAFQTNAPGAASVAAAVRELAVTTGVYQPLDPTTNTTSAGPPPVVPRLN